MHNTIYIYIYTPKCIKNIVLSITSRLSLGAVQCNSFTYYMLWMLVAGSFAAFTSYIYHTFIVLRLLVGVSQFYIQTLHLESEVPSSNWACGSVSVTWDCLIVLNCSCWMLYYPKVRMKFKDIYCKLIKRSTEWKTIQGLVSTHWYIS